MFSIHCALEDLAKLETGGYYADCALAEKAPQVINVNYDEGQGGRTWQAFGGGKNGHETFRQARIYNFRDKCIVIARNLKFSNLTQ